ncbi:acanthoscurrin-2-like [Ostrea edulis]|uniref:acanthoscurrin-2-like n=1 Tax=Ostrea edulis TaxID=37623 RepID=UPI002094A9F9|nr:acanthoscurrin-2-like [Ostrea edulis]
MKSVCIALLVACVLISVVHGQWHGSYGRGGWGDDYYGGYGLGGGYYGGGGLILGGRFDKLGGGLGGGLLGTKRSIMKSVCLALLVACVLISVVHCQWHGSYGRGGWGDDYYGGYGLGGGYYRDGLIGGGRFDRWSGGFGGGLLGIGRGGLRRRTY